MAKLTSWQRLESVIHYSKMTTNAFAKSLSLKRSENLYQIKRGNNGISKELATLIVTNYPEIDKLWLLTGEGNMFANNNSVAPSAALSGGIPFYDADLESVIKHKEQLIPSYHIMMPTLVGCDFAIKFYGNAMEPSLSSGAILFVAKVDSRIILFGQIYLVVTPACSLIRVVKKGESDDMVSLTPLNEQEYDSISIKREDIEQLYVVKGVYQPFL